LIASFLHNFIFLKTRKVGGTSLEIVLSSWCRGRDICTPMPDEDEVLRWAYGGTARNFAGPAGQRRFYNHMPAGEIRQQLPRLWERAFKFAVDRHPYEKVISRAWWDVGRRDGDPERELSATIDHAIQSRQYLNYPIYMIDGELAVDELWRYEDAWNRLAELARGLGLPLPEDEPRAKAGYRPQSRGGIELLTYEQRNQIYRDARVEFDLLGYEP
jgi:hypothetical protein